MDIRQARIFGRQQLVATSYSPDLDARLLLEHVLEMPHSALIAYDRRQLTSRQEEQYRGLLQRAQRKVPIPYLVGHAGFLGQNFTVTPAVLIPRPETEQLVEMALAWARRHRPNIVVDVGTGSGCIIIGMANQTENVRLAATDVSAGALSVAIQNAQRLAPGRVEFYKGNLLEPVPFDPDLIVANLPYVADDEWTLVDDGVKWYEPVLALRGGADGLDLIRELLQQAAGRLRPGGALFLEVGWRQGPNVARLASEYFPEAEIEVTADLAGNHRIVSAVPA